MSDLRFEHRREALGIGVAAPRLSWITETAVQGWRQAAYAVEAYDASGSSLLEQPGRIETAESVLVPWPFAPLGSGERRLLRVRVWGVDGAASAWSELAPVEAGLLAPGDWAAQFIAPDWDEDPVEVGAGSYRWSYAYALPKAERRRLTLDSTLGELAEEPEAYARVMAIYAQHNLEYSYRMEGQLAVTLRQAARQNQYSDALAQRVQQALDEAAG